MQAGITPYQNFKLKSGRKLLITLKKQDYRDKRLEITLSGGINKVSNIRLTPNFGSLEVITEPSGTEVWIAGENKGFTPYSDGHILSGAYLLSLRKSLYQPLENLRVDIKGGKKTVKRFTLKPNFGVLKVRTTPSGVIVKVLGQNRKEAAGFTSPAEIKLSPGSYNLILEKKRIRSTKIQN